MYGFFRQTFFIFQSDLSLSDPMTSQYTVCACVCVYEENPSHISVKISTIKLTICFLL